MISGEGMRPRTISGSRRQSCLQKGIESGKWIRDDFDRFFHDRVWNCVDRRKVGCPLAVIFFRSFVPLSAPYIRYARTTAHPAVDVWAA